MIGQRIRYYRKTKGLTQEELARGICSVSYLSKIENGDAKSSEDVIELLCERLGISPKEEQLDVNILGLLNEWNYLLITRKFEEATKVHLQLESHLPFVEDPNILVKYDLIHARVYLKNNNIEQANELLNKINKLKEVNFNTSLLFYLSFTNGLYQYVNKNFKEALAYFEEAESNLQQATFHQVEIAEYYYMIALTHSQLFHNTSVINFAYKALTIYDKEYFFSRSSDCQLLLGIINRRINNYSQSEYHFKQALKFAESFNDSHALARVYHNLGYLHSNKNEHEIAIDFYTKSLKIKENNEEANIQPTYFLIAKEYYNLGKIEITKKWLKKIEEYVDENQNKEYYIHHKILKERLKKSSSKEFELFLKKEAIPFFQKKNIMEYVCEYASLLAEIYFKTSQYKNSSEYYKLAYNARKEFI